jgi:hypothetical protein
MAVHYTSERSKYGTLTGSIIVWPIEVTSAQDPNESDNIKVLPAGYLRCDGAKYSADQYPQLAEVIGTGVNCKFRKYNNK